MEKRFSWKLWLMDMMSLADDMEEAQFSLDTGKGWVMELDGQSLDKLRAEGFYIHDEWCKDWVE